MSSLLIAGHEFHSRLFTGTGKYASADAMMDSLTASESELVTLSLRRMDLKNHTDNILQPLQQQGIKLLPNTSGARTAKEAVFAAELAREALETHWVKLEIHPDPRYLMPDGMETLLAAEELIKKVLWSCLMFTPILCFVND